MLSPRAVKNFLKEPRDSFDFMKKLTRRELVSMVNELDPKPQFVSPYKMWTHQLAAFLIGVHMPQFLFFIDMGGGKTRVILELVRYRRLCGDKRGALIITVDDINIENWLMEAEVHAPDLEVVPLFGGTEDRRELIWDESDLYLAHYAALYHLVSYIPKPRSAAGKAKLSRKRGAKSKISPAKVRDLTEALNLMCLDECTKIMNRKSLTFRSCLKIGEQLDYRYGLAGKPFGRDPKALWSQFYYCDHGETLGTTIAMFQQALFKKKFNRFSSFPEWVFDKSKADELHRIIKHRSITYKEREFRKVPKVSKRIVKVHFTDDMKVYYNKVVDKLKEKGGSRRLVQNSFMHMRQIGSGFIGLIDDETGARAQIEFPRNPKMEAVESIVAELLENDRRFLIYHQYTWTGSRICKVLDSMNVPYRRLRGGQKKENPRILREFRKSKKIDGLVIQNQVGAYGLNLQVASAIIYVESPVSPIDRDQSEKRLRPALNPRRCLYFDIVMQDNSADENIQAYLKEGRNLEAAVMRGRNVFKRLRRV